MNTITLNKQDFQNILFNTQDFVVLPDNNETHKLIGNGLDPILIRCSVKEDDSDAEKVYGNTIIIREVTYISTQIKDYLIFNFRKTNTLAKELEYFNQAETTIKEILLSSSGLVFTKTEKGQMIAQGTWNESDSE